MNRAAFGKINRYAWKATALVRPDPARDEPSRLVVWAAIGLLTGFLAAAIECL